MDPGFALMAQALSPSYSSRQGSRIEAIKEELDVRRESTKLLCASYLAAVCLVLSCCVPSCCVPSCCVPNSCVLFTYGVFVSTCCFLPRNGRLFFANRGICRFSASLGGALFCFRVPFTGTTISDLCLCVCLCVCVCFFFRRFLQ